MLPLIPFLLCVFLPFLLLFPLLLPPPSSTSLLLLFLLLFPLPPLYLLPPPSLSPSPSLPPPSSFSSLPPPSLSSSLSLPPPSSFSFPSFPLPSPCPCSFRSLQQLSYLTKKKPLAPSSGLIIHIHGGGFVAQSPKTHEVQYTNYYHTSNSRKHMEVNGEALQLHAVYKKPYFLL